MKKITLSLESGSALICVLCTILVISVIAGGVLFNCTARYNATSKQVKAWKESLYAAEAGGDLGYAECRKFVSDRANQFSGWTTPSPVPTPGPAYTKNIPPFGQSNSLSTSVVVDQFTTVSNNPCYRIRATGTARVFGLRRTGMDDRMNATTRGDSLLRKIDFTYDHFKATYGDGDGNNKGVVGVSNPQITRRIELIATPLLPFEAAIKCTTSFSGPGSAGLIDSYDSHNGAYYFAADNPADPHYSDSRNGDVAVNSPSFNQGNIIYGNVDTNGGTVTHSNSNITGTIDNSVSFTVPPLVQPELPSGTSYQPGTPSTITPPADAGTKEAWYLYSSLNGVTINALKDGSNNPIETFVTIIVTGDVGDVTIAKGVNAKIYFTGNFSSKARNTVNNNVDGATGVKNADGSASSRVSRTAHLQFYGISPTNGAAQTINVTPPGSLWCTFYAPSADFRMNGNPKLYGAVVCKSFDGNGNTAFHYDKALAGEGYPVDYRVASYIEDIR